MPRGPEADSLIVIESAPGEHMGEFSIFHWLIVLFVLGLFVVLPLFLAYRHGKAVGERDGYIKGLKEGQERGKP